MNPDEEVERLLDVTLTMQKDFESFKKNAQTTNNSDRAKQDRDMRGLYTRVKKLNETISVLSTAVDESSKRVEAVKVEQQKDDGSALALKNDTDHLVQAGETLARLQNIVTIQNNPAVISTMLTPPISFTFSGFKERKRKDESVYTDPFYSHSSGYKMCLKVYFNGQGDGKGTHISVYMIILPGEFDEILEWPFAGSLMIQLVNQRKNKFHHSKTLNLWSEDNLQQRLRPAPDTNRNDLSPWGYCKFISHTELPAKGMLADREYLKNDKLVFRVYKVNIYNLRY